MKGRIGLCAVFAVVLTWTTGCIFISYSGSPKGSGAQTSFVGEQADAKAGQLTPLMLAAHKGENGKVADLAKIGEKPNARGPHGWTALHYAAAGGHQATAAALVEAGADARLRNDDGQTPAEVADQFKNEGTAADLRKAEERH